MTAVKNAARVAIDMALLVFKLFQEAIFWTEAKTVVLHWSRQIGKSYVLAAWAVYRCVKKCLAKKNWLVCVLSNSKDNGTEFMQKVKQICDLLRIACEAEDLSPDDFIENMRIECRIKIGAFEARIKVLAANPRTARGFSGDLILDEFAFHEDSYAIWDAAEPILSSNSEFQCRIASTGNGCYNMFYNMVAGAKARADKSNPSGLCYGTAGFMVSRVSRSAAHAMGQKIYDLKTGEEITPDAARERALDKASYDQNYELAFNDENMALLTHDLISGAEYKQGADEAEQCYICKQEISPEALAFLLGCRGPLIAGMDIGRNKDLTVFSVGEAIGDTIFTRLILELSNMRLPHQQERIMPVLSAPRFGCMEGDMTGLGLGLVEYAQEVVGTYRVRGVNFSTKELRDPDLVPQGAGGTAKKKAAHPSDMALVTEIMALDGLQHFESRRIRIPRDTDLRDDLRKPERITTASGVRISAVRDEAGHADRFWAIMLMIRAARTSPGVISDVKGIRMGGNGPSNRPHFKPRKLGGIQA